MGFFKKLFQSAPSNLTQDFHTFSVKCDRCGEVIEGRVNLANELSADDAGEGFHARKVLMGSGHCFQQIEVELNFDSNRRLTARHATGGKFME